MIVRMSIQKVTVLLNTNIIFTVILGTCFLGEYPTPSMIALVGLSFLGVVLLVDPSLIGLGGVLKENSEQDQSCMFTFFLFFLLILLTFCGKTLGFTTGL